MHQVCSLVSLKQLFFLALQQYIGLSHQLVVLGLVLTSYDFGQKTWASPKRSLDRDARVTAARTNPPSAIYDPVSVFRNQHPPEKSSSFSGELARNHTENTTGHVWAFFRVWNSNNPWRDHHNFFLPNMPTEFRLDSRASLP